MEELNELNDIILNKSGLKSGRQKWLLIILLLTLILVAIVVGIRSLKSDDIQKVLQSVLPPEPNAPTEVINDPIVDPVKTPDHNTTVQTTQPKEVIPETSEEIPDIQEKPITPSAPKEVLEETSTKTIIQPAPVAKTPEKKSESVKQTPEVIPVSEKKPQVVADKPKKEPTTKEDTKKEPLKKEPKPIVQPKKVIPEVKTPAPVKKVAESKPTPKETTNSDTTTYYIQVGSFSKEPNPSLLDHLNASGLKYTTRKVGEMTKLLVGPYQGEQAAKEGLANVRQNVEAQAFRVK